MESLSAERDCSTLVGWWEGGGSNVGLQTGGGERKCGSLDIPRLGKTLQRGGRVYGRSNLPQGSQEKQWFDNQEEG